MPVQSEHYLGLPGDIAIGVTSDRDVPLTPKEELLLGAYLPEVKLLTAAPPRTDMMLHHVESADRTLAVGHNEIEIRDQWHGEFPADLPHVLYSVARSIWLARGYYPTHAACVGDNDFVLLPGHSGVGKTTTALAAMANHNQKVLSGNTTLIKFTNQGDMQAIAGTKTMTLRTKDFEQGQYDAQRTVEYDNRTAFELPAEKRMDQARRIARIALVRLNDGRQAWSTLSPLSALHTLYPHFLDTEYADCIVANGNAVYLGDTPARSRTELTAKLGRSLLGISAHSGIGDKEFLAQKVARG